MRNIFQWSWLLALAACTNAPPASDSSKVVPPTDTAAKVPPAVAPPPPPTPVKVDTVAELRDRPDSIFFYRSPDGKVFRVLQWKGKEEHDTAVGKMSVRKMEVCGADDFTGVKRAAAKTSSATGHKTTYATVVALRASLKDEAYMRAHLNSSSPRIPEEKHKVKLEDVFLLGVAHESDNDYHLIVGDAIAYTAANLMNVEISGIPASGSSTLQTVRDAFETHFTDVCGSSYKVFLDNPPRITVEGSIFYDVDHATGTSGTGDMKPSTSWEIHPVSKFIVL